MNGKNKKRKQMSVVKYNSTPKNSLITKGGEKAIFFNVTDRSEKKLSLNNRKSGAVSS